MSFRARLRPLKRAFAPVIESAWRASFTVYGAMRGSRARRWDSDGTERVLVIAPHPDDEVIGCGGTMLRHLAARDAVAIAIATDGRRAGFIRDPDVMAARRHDEAHAAADVLGVTSLHWLGLPEGEWQTAALAGGITKLLHELRPTLLYLPSRVDFHPEHHRVAHAAALALAEIPEDQRPRNVRVYQVQVPLTRELVNLVCDLDVVQAHNLRALRAHASQLGSIECTFRRLRYSASLHRLRGAAEEFWELPTAAYVRLHRDAPAGWRDHFRGLRNFPLTDPLAWMVGRAARRRLAATVHASA